MITEYITKMSSNKNLSHDEMSHVMDDILSGKISVDETTSFLGALTKKEKLTKSFLQC